MQFIFIAQYALTLLETGAECLNNAAGAFFGVMFMTTLALILVNFVIKISNPFAALATDFVASKLMDWLMGQVGNCSSQ